MKSLSKTENGDYRGGGRADMRGKEKEKQESLPLFLRLVPLENIKVPIPIFQCV